jgi:glycosyltransferase involved in cell wall biosynthesis
MKDYFFTIFTPAYNCENTIQRVFDSVKIQTFRDFEWIIINDGSTDDSDTVIKKLINSYAIEIPIKYISQTNMGKHIAWNKAVEISNGKYFIPADSDDSFSQNALEFFYEKINLLDSKIEQQISGINVLCFDNDTNLIKGDKFPKDNFLTNNFELAYKYKIKGEKWGCIKTNLLKKIKFPIVKNSYFPEAYLWFSLAIDHKVICYNTALRNYFSNNSGIMALSKNRDHNERKVNITYLSWLIRNFGVQLFYVSPINLIKHFARLTLDLINVYIIQRKTTWNKIGDRI